MKRSNNLPEYETSIRFLKKKSHKDPSNNFQETQDLIYPIILFRFLSKRIEHSVLYIRSTSES